MTKAQTEYMCSKAVVEALKEEMDALEAEYCRENKLVSESGKPIVHIWMLDDDAEFERHNERFSEKSGQAALDKLLEAEENLSNAENALIDEGLMFASRFIPKEADLLRANIKNAVVREKIIDIAFRVNYDK